MTIKRRSPKQGATTQVARCFTAVTPQSSHADVKLCSSPSDTPSSPILTTHCLKVTRPPHRALLQSAALHSQRSDKRSQAAGSYILALHASNELLGSALPPDANGHAVYWYLEHMGNSATSERVSEVQRFRAAHPT
ncbi:hypothetical protein D6C98_09492 [Aureobasidium pullulans]|nr:hypothetical protein D6C98_09492 [Aureobasidium pullulans]